MTKSAVIFTEEIINEKLQFLCSIVYKFQNIIKKSSEKKKQKKNVETALVRCQTTTVTDLVLHFI